MSKIVNNAQKFKELVSKYWYIAVPVHAGTSVCWFGSTYSATKMGFDFLPYLEKTNIIPDFYMEPLKKGNLGNFAQAAILYKLVTPLRYASTLAVTRSVIIQLRKRNMIK